MKKFLLITLCVIMVMVFAVSFASCKTSSEATGEKQVVIGLSLAGRYSLAFVAGEDYIKRLADEKKWFVTTTVAENDITKQAQDIEDLISRGVDVVVSVPIDSKAIVSSIESAHKAGIPHITFLRPEDPAATGEGKADSYCGQDTKAQAYDAAMALAPILEADGIKAADVKIINVIGDLKDENAVYRREGFMQAAEENGWTIIAEVPSEWNPDKALTGTTSALEGNPDANAIFVASDFIWPAVKTAMQSKDMLFANGEAGHIYVVSQDVYPVGYEDIVKGYIDTNAALDVGEMAKLLIADIEIILGGGKPDHGLIKGRVATIDNVEEMLNLWGKDFR